jgi:ADP-heptose:LPS heptosyltransferase
MDSRPLEIRSSAGSIVIGPRVLIVKFSAIGDCVMAVPAASVVRRCYEDAFIAWAVDSRCAAVVDTKRLVDLRYEIPREEWKQKGMSWWHQYRYFARLRPFRFDYGMDLQGHSKTAICLRIARPNKRIAARATDIFTRLINPVAKRYGSSHIVERNLEVLQQLGDFSGDATPIMPDYEPYVPRLVRDVPNLTNLVTISISAGHPKKVFPAERWEAVGRSLVSAGYTLGILGGARDVPPRVPGAIDWVGKLTLQESMAAVASSRLHLAADTGTGHIAAAYGVPVVSVFGYTKASVYRPYTESAIVLDAGKSMSGVSAQDIIEAANSLIDHSPHALSH